MDYQQHTNYQQYTDCSHDADVRAASGSLVAWSACADLIGH